MDLPTKVVWWPGDGGEVFRGNKCVQSSSIGLATVGKNAAWDFPLRSLSEVAYQVHGKPRCIMEAAAARAFSGVPGATLQALCDDIHAGAQKTRAESVLTLIKAFSDRWGWSEWDVAEAMMPLLSKELKEPQIPKKSGKLVPVLEQVAAMGEALRQHRAATAADALGSGAGLQEHTGHVAKAVHILRRGKFGNQKRRLRGWRDISVHCTLPQEHPFPGALPYEFPAGGAEWVIWDWLVGLELQVLSLDELAWAGSVN